MLECWNIGEKKKEHNPFILDPHYSLPAGRQALLHYSNIPWVLFDGPLLQLLVVCRATDPFPGLLIKEKWNASAVPFVILPQEFRVCIVMPDFEFRNF